MPTILEVDPHDEPVLRAFWETEQAAIRAHRKHVEDHPILPLPVPGDRVSALRASLPDLDGYEVVTGGDR